VSGRWIETNCCGKLDFNFELLLIHRMSQGKKDGLGKQNHCPFMEQLQPLMTKLLILFFCFSFAEGK